MKTIVLTGGGTAGHVTPALALIPELKKRFDKIIFIGSKNGIEKNLALNAGLEYYFVPTVKLERRLTAKNLLIPFKLGLAVREAKKILKSITPTVIFSKGGFVSLPTVIAGKQLGIPIVCHESDLSVGLANKIGARYSSLFLTSFDCTSIKGVTPTFVGNPLNERLFYNYDKKQLLKKYGLTDRKKILLIFGGSSGSQAINDMVNKCLYKLINRYSVIHLCGKGKGEAQREKGYIKIEYTNDIAELYTLCDLCASRAGANSLFELTALNKPTLAIPLSKSASRGDQIENAEYFKKRKMIEVLYEENLNETTFISAIQRLEGNANQLSESCKFKNHSLPNKRIVELICSVCK